MSKIYPYQPILLRILHGAIALLTFAALITGFMVYDRFDKRLGTLNLPEIPDVMGIHGTISLTFLIILPIFALYCFHLGDRRLVQAKTLGSLTVEVGKPVWWISLQRLVNTCILLAATLAVITGRMMQEKWLPNQDLTQVWYSGHLFAWALMIVSVAMHLLMNAKIGGLPLLLSIYHWKVRAEDMPQNWLERLKIKPSSLILLVFEALVLTGIAIAFILPLFVSS
ncbi:MAG: cytochrome B [Oscillatoriales cyanobacterium CG2_30_44_21]|nr:MAG: cytochrome B [Oscillatoriales cyanobacterium CG2_30_44_21]